MPNIAVVYLLSITCDIFSQYNAKLGEILYIFLQ